MGIKYFLGVSTIILLQTGVKSQVFLQGNFQNLKENQKVYYYKPIGSYNNIYYDAQEIALKSDGSFNISIPLYESCFLNIVLPDANGIVSLFAKPNDSISVTAIFNGNQSGRNKLESLIYRGSNSEGHSLYSNLKLKFNQEYILHSIFPCKFGLSASDFIDNCISILNSVKKPFDSLYKQGRVSKEFADHASADIISKTLYLSFAIFNGLTLIDTGSILKNNMEEVKKPFFYNKSLYTTTNFEKIKLSLYQHYSPNDTTLLTSGLGLSYCQYYFKDIYAGLIKSENSYDSSFLSLSEESKTYGFMTGKFLEYSWGKNLHWETLTETNSYNLKMNIKSFEKIFPHSQLLPYLRERYDLAISSASDTITNENDITFLNNPYKDLKSLISTNFKGKYVFIDLWATWCSPCVQELIYKSSIDSLLRSLKIEMLYISIDRESDKQKWSSFVKYKKLGGYHFLVNNEFSKNMQIDVYKNKTITVPRYLLINQNGKIISYNLPRPSSMNSLKKELIRLRKQ